MSSQYSVVKIIDDDSVLNNTNVIVPTSYVSQYKDDNQVDEISVDFKTVRYLEGPHSTDDEDLIKSFVFPKNTPPDSWSSFKCKHLFYAGEFLYIFAK